MKPWRRIIQAVCTLIFTAFMLTPTALAAEEISSHEPQPTIQTELISENFYQAVNNQWLSQTEMPADQPFYGQFAVAQDRLDTVLQADLAKMAAGEIHPESPKAQDMIAYYRLAADFNQREADGVSQARRLLAQVEQLTSFKDFEELSQDDLLRFAMLPWSFMCLRICKTPSIKPFGWLHPPLSYRINLSTMASTLPKNNFKKPSKGRTSNCFYSMATALKKLAS
ncbi:hypothetical protein CL176_04790 [Suicoccus acidiformans]|uniref:Peptidase M13 N-terminal domain-containing protein n=1 Tax=Suicoccus acidiformans TaxID=2036206 RepID=A0A347WJW4_9LACT|nr:hypothetical protein [Suicoccus acidiformans]AXY25371.1 hypothetical protein CL176_04790 [Suicoccus acidiformans]